MASTAKGSVALANRLGAQSKFADIRGIKLHYVEIGEPTAPLVVLVHGKRLGKVEKLLSFTLNSASDLTAVRAPFLAVWGCSTVFATDQTMRLLQAFQSFGIAGEGKFLLWQKQDIGSWLWTCAAITCPPNQ
eukprot:2903259-Pyramimonas_sp.AAC.2